MLNRNGQHFHNRRTARRTRRVKNCHAVNFPTVNHAHFLHDGDGFLRVRGNGFAVGESGLPGIGREVIVQVIPEITHKNCAHLLTGNVFPRGECRIAFARHNAMRGGPANRRLKLRVNVANVLKSRVAKRHVRFQSRGKAVEHRYKRGAGHHACRIEGRFAHALD